MSDSHFYDRISINRQREKFMKRIIFAILGFIITTQVMGAISPVDLKLQKAQKEYEQRQIKCTDDKPLYVNGSCIACDEYKNWTNVAGILGCEKCENSSGVGSDCVINCPDDRPVLLSNGACVPCNYKQTEAPIFDVRKGQDKCKECPNDKPVLLREGSCMTCEQVLKKYKVLFRQDVLSGWEECSFDKKYQQNTKSNKILKQTSNKSRKVMGREL